jgi:haloacetate dehalogenase
VVTVFDGFEEFDIETSGARIHGVRGGSGPPVLLLHGIPETHLMWHRVAPQLAEHYRNLA